MRGEGSLGSGVSLKLSLSLSPSFQKEKEASVHANEHLASRIDIESRVTWLETSNLARLGYVCNVYTPYISEGGHATVKADWSRRRFPHRIAWHAFWSRDPSLFQLWNKVVKSFPRNGHPFHENHRSDRYISIMLLLYIYIIEITYISKIR